MTAYSCILAWRIPWTEEPGRLHSPQGCTESDKTEATQRSTAQYYHLTLYICMHFRIYYLHLKSIYKKPINTIFFSLGFPEVVNSLDIPESESCSVMSDSLLLHGLWNSPGHNTGVGSLSLLQGIFPTQGPNPGLPHCGEILYQLSHRRSPRILE